MQTEGKTKYNKVHETFFRHRRQITPSLVSIYNITIVAYGRWAEVQQQQQQQITHNHHHRLVETKQQKQDAHTMKQHAAKNI